MAEPPPTRPSLLVRLRDPRDQAAWTQFITLYGPLVYGYARKQGLQDADAADLSQEVLGTIARAVGRGRVGFRVVSDLAALPDAIQVTLEPASGSPSPGEQVVISWLTG